MFLNVMCYKPHVNIIAAQRGKSLKCCPNIRKFEKSHRLAFFTTRLRHNRIQNPTERIPLTEIYECETATSREKRILKNAVQLYCYSTEANRGSASQERNATLQTLLKVCI